MRAEIFVNDQAGFEPEGSQGRISSLPCFDQSIEARDRWRPSARPDSPFSIKWWHLPLKRLW